MYHQKEDEEVSFENQNAISEILWPFMVGRRKRVATKLLKRLLSPVVDSCLSFRCIFFFLRKDKSVELLLCGTANGTNAATDGCMVRLGKYQGAYFFLSYNLRHNMKLYQFFISKKCLFKKNFDGRQLFIQFCFVMIQKYFLYPI